MRHIILADNQELTAFAVDSLASKLGDVRTHRAPNRGALIKQLREHENAVVVLDYALFDFESPEQLVVLSERYELALWVLLSDDLTDQFMRKVVFASHRFSIVFKDQPLKSVRDALQAALRGERFICQRATEVLIARQVTDDEPARLTQTEIEILRGIAQGKTTKEIAADRVSSIHTINTHRKNIFRKLSVNTAHEAVKYAFRAGLVDPSEFYI